MLLKNIHNEKNIYDVRNRLRVTIDNFSRNLEEHADIAGITCPYLRDRCYDIDIAWEAGRSNLRLF